MIKRTNFFLDGHQLLKCKSCKQEFYVVSAAVFEKTVCFCPFCGDYANKIDKIREYEGDEDDDYQE